VAVVVPLALYATAFLIGYGQFALVSSGPRFLYARIAPFVACERARLPSYERPLCPQQPVGHRPDTDFFMWGAGRGPAYHLNPPKGMTSDQVIKDFDKRMLRAQPMTYARYVLRDAAGGFAPSRAHDVPGYPSSYWLFRSYNWSLDSFAPWRQRYAHEYGVGTQASAAAGFLTGYRMILHTPGPLLAALLLVGVVAAFGVGRSRYSGVRVAVGLLTACCAVTLLTAAAFSGFSWRYQLPQMALLPMAGALGLAALVRGSATGTKVPLPLPLVDRWAGVIEVRRMRMPGPEAEWVTRDAGFLQPALAVVAGLGSGCVVALAGVLSGWFTVGTGVVIGMVVFVAVTTSLIVAHWRAPPRSEPPDLGSGTPVESTESV
jgi:hypothetical protein